MTIPRLGPNIKSHLPSADLKGYDEVKGYFEEIGVEISIPQGPQSLKEKNAGLPKDQRYPFLSLRSEAGSINIPSYQPVDFTYLGHRYKICFGGVRKSWTFTFKEFKTDFVENDGDESEPMPNWFYKRDVQIKVLKDMMVKVRPCRRRC